MRNNCKEFSPEKCTALKIAELKRTACCHFDVDEIDVSRKPR